LTLECACEEGKVSTRFLKGGAKKKGLTLKKGHRASRRERLPLERKSATRKEECHTKGRAKERC